MSNNKKDIEILIHISKLYFHIYKSRSVYPLISSTKVLPLPELEFQTAGTSKNHITGKKKMGKKDSGLSKAFQ